MNYTKEQVEHAREYLSEVLKPGDTVYTTVTHVARSGMSRNIRLFYMTEDGPHDISFLAAHLMGAPIAKNGGLKVGGCGMDMGFWVVYNLSHVLFPRGFMCVGKKRCPSCDHSNGDRNYRRHLHKSGGYALNQKWL
jgi:hypothetical protein